MTYHFTLTGNQDNHHGNPVPFQRVLAQKMRASSIRYLEWQQFVRATFKDQCRLFSSKGTKFDAPITLGSSDQAIMAIHIVWANEQHGDADNVWKGIADALFVNDKHVVGCFTASHGTRGSFEVHIDIIAPGQVDQAAKKRSTRSGIG